VAASVNLVARAPGPHLLYIALRDGAPLAKCTAGHPRSGHGIKVRLGRWTESEEINLTVAWLHSVNFINSS
jgi:hypothetical protein